MAKKITKEEYNNKKKQELNKSNKKNINIFGIISLILNIIFAILIIIGIIGWINKENKLKEGCEKKVQSKINTINIYKSSLESINGDKDTLYTINKLEFFDDSIVFVIKGYGNNYYNYDCMMKKIGDKDFSFLAYNKEAAINEGYKKGSC